VFRVGFVFLRHILSAGPRLGVRCMGVLAELALGVVAALLTRVERTDTGGLLSRAGFAAL
jgi:hypothetical protein